MISLSTFSQAQFRFQHLYGGVNNERGQTLLETFNNKYIFNGATTSYGQGSADAILIKTDNDGQIIWSKVYGTSEYDNSEYVVEATDYGYVGVGRSIVILPMTHGSSKLIRPVHFNGRKLLVVRV